MPWISKSIVSRSSYGRLAVVVLVCFVGLIGAQGRAAAKARTVVVETFSGPRATEARKAVLGLVDKLQVIPLAQFGAAAKRLKIKKRSAEAYVALAEELGADAFIDGRVVRTGGRFMLEIVVRDGNTGKPTLLKTPLRGGPRVDARAKKALQRRLDASLDRIEPLSLRVAKRKAPAAEEKDEEQDQGRSGKKKNSRDRTTSRGADPLDEDLPRDTRRERGSAPVGDARDEDKDGRVALEVEDSKSRRRRVRSSDEDDPQARKRRAQDRDEFDAPLPEDGGGEVEDDDKPEARKRRPMNTTGRDDRDSGGMVSGGVSFLGRNLSFTYAAGLATIPAGYTGSPVPGGYVRGELYPFSMGEKPRSGVSGLGLTGYFDRVFSLKSQLEDGTTFTSTQTRFGLGGVYRWNFGDVATKPSIKLGLGYNKLSFNVNAMGMPLDLPNVAYSYADVGAQVILPVAAEGRFRLFLGGAYLHVLGTGDMQTAANYGGGKVAGMDVSAGAEIRIGENWLVRAAGQYIRIAYTFDGTGAKATMRNANPDLDVGGALDVFMGGFVTAGYQF